MKIQNKEKQSKDVFSELLPQAISVLKKTIIAPLFSDNLFHRYANEKPPLRSELFSMQQMENHAKNLAGKHILTRAEPSEKMLKRLGENESLLMEIYSLLTETVKSNIRIAPAGEWLLDNFYLIEEQVNTGKKHLPKGYSKGLPQLANGASKGLPRVYDIVVELISHSDGRVDTESLSGFINAYQSVTPLQLGELWAIPIMLRLALIENLRRLSTEIALDILHKNLADYWADQMLEILDKDPKNLVVVIADMARSKPPAEGAFVAELTRKLQGRGASLSLPLSWIEQFVSDMSLTGAELVHIENQKQAARQVSVSNSISSLRFLNSADWRNFVEAESIVEKILNEDPDAVYGKMDFYTRDHYRHVVEKTSKYSALSEEEVAKIAIRLAQLSPENGRKRHVGYYLVDKGVSQVEKIAKVNMPFAQKLRNHLAAIPLFYYLLGITSLTFFFLSILAYHINESLQTWQYGVLLLICAIAVSQPAIALFNWITTLLTHPNPLPRMDFSSGIPQECSTLIVIPTLLTSTDAADSLVEALEVRYVANRDDHLHFALLTDFKDAATETLPEDEALLAYAKNKITALNERYGRAANDIFMLFHRPRKWNEKEGVWMGHERKRGKLKELNALLRGEQSENFSLVVADQTLFPGIKYIITLDTDTKLPREAAWKMTASLAHPLNKAVYCSGKKRVTEGYTILQPRVSNSLPGPRSSWYARIHGNEPGIDPYTRMTSDVYQDLFSEGSFIGKGIYEIDTFTASLSGRFPENRILSHDLVEGCYARSGFLSDVQLYEAYPPSYYADMQRRQRWIRGDWQILRWLFPLVPAPDKRYRRNPLSALSHWKIFDNIRRSLVAPSLLLLLLYGWLFSSGSFWSIAVTGIILIPSLIKLLWDLLNKPKDIGIYPHLVFMTQSAKDTLLRHLPELLFLPYEAFVNMHAIVRTAWRIFISKRNLLQWNPSGNSIRSAPKTLFDNYIAMWTAPVFATGILMYLFYTDALAAIIDLPLLISWMLSPGIAYLISMPRKPRRAALSRDQIVFLHKLSRRIWAFFEKFVTDEDNWLPPDNYQKQPGPKIAHRTSPTNIGLSLLANLTAYDFGYLSAGRLIDRTTRTFHTVQALEKYKGHLYNWYDTITLSCLQPRYISTVDSGNFIGHVITLKQGLLHLKESRIFSARILAGLLDTVAVLLEKDEKDIAVQELKKEIEAAQINPPQSLRQVMVIMEHLKSKYHIIVREYENGKKEAGNKTSEWVALLGVQLNDITGDLITLAPWLLLQPPSPAFNHIIDDMDYIPTLRQLSSIQTAFLPEVKSFYRLSNTPAENDWLDMLVSHIIQSSRRAKERIQNIEYLAEQCDDFSDVEYDFLYSKTQHLLAIGYNAEEHRRDNSYYDLLASEARLGNFVAIAQGKLPQESWFALGRQLTSFGSAPALLSWSGSMFEYLMPDLVMPSYENTLLDQTQKAVVQKQIDYGNKRDVPWGISESGYNMIDSAMNYQYKAFGVPGTGFKRGLGEELVISPYSAVMALMVMPEEACDNLQLMAKKGFTGTYGFYEAIDYTPSRLPRGQEHVIIQSFMIHHQGMSLLALSHLLLNQPMQKRFISDVQFQATLLLLQERIPRVTALTAPGIHIADAGVINKEDDAYMRIINTPQTANPEIQLLSNGRYHVMVSNAGGGYSRWKNIAVTRWREDSTCDNWGNFCFIRDLENNEYWSCAYQPALQNGDHYEAVFSQGRAEFRRRDFAIEAHTEIVVSPEDDVELRRLHLTNRSRKKKIIEVTSYAEVVLAPMGADAAHPAFSNLFVQTALLQESHAIICTRRARSQDEQPPSMFHLMKVHHAVVQSIAYETDRTKFTGRGNTIHQPLCMQQTPPLSFTEGSVLDPIVSIQYRIEIAPQQTAVIDMITGIAETKEGCMDMIGKYQDKFLVDRGFELSWTHSQIVLRQINATEADAQLYAKLASAVIYTDPAFRGAPDLISRNNRGQSSLWSHSISGDLPIVLVKIEDVNNIELVKQMIQAHAYWRLKGMIVDLVIWNEDHGSYRHTLQNQIMSLVVPLVGAQINEDPGGVFIRSADQLSNEDRILFQTVARVVLSDKFGSLEEQLNRNVKIKNVIPYFTPVKFYPSTPTAVTLPENLQFFNGTGGFSENGREYIILTEPGKVTPAPWCNVVANAGFGSIISESGQAYTWLENAHEFRITPWNNNPVSDLEGECYYLRDEESGKFWSPAPLPARSKTPYITRHGFGYSIFEHSEDGIYSEMTVFVDLDNAVKFTMLNIQNRSGRQRKLSVTGYVEWVLGEFRPKTQMHIVTTAEGDTGTLFARNDYNTEFAGRVAFFDAGRMLESYTCDRKEFLGRNGSSRNPAAMNKVRLSGKSGPALDPCAAIQITIDLAGGESHEIIFKLGAAKSHADALHITEQFKTHANVHQALDKVQHFWQRTLGTIQVYTPDAALNILTNGWLNYQTLASRIWGRSGYYQSGGAFGFRDQLQDILSLLYTRPDISRAQILLNASRQFKEGDVQHWWHPPSGRGVRTTCSDDYLWLPYVTAKYTAHTGDTEILEEVVGFIEGRPLNEGEASYYDLPSHTHQTASLYIHCKKAIERALHFGEHGLPLIGSGDWNDGMDKVGEKGKGESVWLAFFLYDTLNRFNAIAAKQGDTAFEQICREQAAALRKNIALHGWDGQWYRRAYFDDGTPLGSSQNEEASIDSIAQSWSVLSQAGDAQRTATAMQSASKYLVRKDAGLIQLLNPPFDSSSLNPGYIKGYVPGVRENGGQYTHAAIWFIMALMALKDKEQGWNLLQMINPVNRGSSAEAIATYKVEPYVIAADVYFEPSHLGQGGWTWYTGSAAWMYQLILESFLGIKQKGTQLYFDPCTPPAWTSFTVRYKYMDTLYNIHINTTGTGENQIITDGRICENNFLPLLNDGGEHTVEVVTGSLQVQRTG